VPSGTPQTLLPSALVNPRWVGTLGEYLASSRRRPYGEVDHGYSGRDANLQGERRGFPVEHSVEVLIAVHCLRCGSRAALSDLASLPVEPDRHDVVEQLWLFDWR
jgi:hypothetical protein